MSLLSGNLIRFGAQIDNRVRRELTKMSGDFNRVSSSKGFGSIVEGIGLGIGLQAWQALGGGVSQVIGTIQSSIDAASNMNETITKSQAVFGDASAELEAWSSTAATAMGQSSRLALESAASFGNLFKSMGLKGCWIVYWNSVNNAYGIRGRLAEQKVGEWIAKNT